MPLVVITKKVANIRKVRHLSDPIPSRVKLLNPIWQIVELLNCFPFLMDSISLKLFQEFNFKNLEFREFNFWLQNVEEKGEKSAIQGDR